MKNCFAIIGREMRSYFVSPMGYIVIMFFLGICGYFNYLYIARFSQMYAQYQALSQAYRNPAIMQQLNINQMIFQPLMGTINVILIFSIPFITMWLLAEERRSGTAELLFTSPLTTTQIVLGKFFSAFLFFLVMIGLTLTYPWILDHYGDPERGPFFSGYLGLLLIGGAYISIGLFISSLFRMPLLAGFVTFVVLLLLWLIGSLAERLEAYKSIIEYFALATHFEDFPKGLLNATDITYFVSFIFVFLFLTKLSLDSLRWR